MSAAMVDLVDYWINLPSSIQEADPARNFNFAVRRASWTAQQFLHQRFDELSRERLGFKSLNNFFDADQCESVELYEEVPDPSDGPEDLTCEDAELQSVREFLAELPSAELRRWLHDFVAGVPARAQARLEGVDHAVVVRRRQRGMQRLRTAAASFGLLGGDEEAHTGSSSPVARGDAGGVVRG